MGLVSAVVITFYTCLLPHQWHESVFWAIYHLIVGHWFLMNTAFHYYKAAFTDPGTPPQVTNNFHREHASVQNVACSLEFDRWDVLSFYYYFMLDADNEFPFIDSFTSKPHNLFIYETDCITRIDRYDHSA